MVLLVDKTITVTTQFLATSLLFSMKEAAEEGSN